MIRNKASKQIVGKNLPWKDIFISVAKIFFFATLLGTLVAIVFAQWPGFLGYLGGAMLVFICFSTGALTASLAGRRSMIDAARAMIFAYTIKVGILGLFLILVPLPESIRNGWTLAGAIVSVIVWLTVEMRTMLSLRILYFDLPE